MPSSRKCPFCAEEVLAEAIKCKHCGSAITRMITSEVTRSREPWLRREMRSPLVKYGGGFLLLVTALGLLALPFKLRTGPTDSLGRPCSGPTANPQECYGHENPTVRLSVGQDGALVDDSGVALTDRAWDDLSSAVGAKDRLGYQQVFMRGEAILVKKGTRVKVIDNGFASQKVRILDGPHVGKAGWVPPGWVR